MARAKRRTTVKIVKVYNPARSLQLKGAKPMAKTHAARAANPRRRRRGGSRRRRNTSTPRSRAVARRNPATRTRVVYAQAANPRRRKSSRRRRRNPSRRFNPSRRQLTSVVKMAFWGAVGALAVNAAANFNPFQKQLSPWLNVGVKGGIAYALGPISGKVLSAENAQAVQAGALISTAIDAFTIVLPWASQQIPTLFGTSTNAADANLSGFGLGGDLAGFQSAPSMYEPSPEGYPVLG